MLAAVADGTAEDVEAAIAAARAGFETWRRVAPLERARLLRRVATILREHAGELAMIDAADCGNPVKEMVGDAMVAAAQMEFFAGFVTEMKGASIPMGPDAVNFSVREPLGVVGRIIPFNHPFMFCAGKSAAPLAAGNTVDRQAAGAGAAVVAASCRAARRRAAARRLQRRAGGGAEVGAALACASRRWPRWR